MPLRPYSGPERLIFGVDVGTTMSAVSLVHLVHGTTPVVSMISRWPGQDDSITAGKFPTAVFYDVDGVASHFGVEAIDHAVADDPGSLVKWFKLHLHTADMRLANNIVVPSLPHGVTINTVYRDFLWHVISHSIQYFKDTRSHRVWERVSSSYELVFAIPNGWSEWQQKVIRDAIISAQLLPPEHVVDRISFVSEAEASVHYALEHMSLALHLVPGGVFTVLDAGGSTVDSTLYRCESVEPIVLVEVTESECVQAGSVFVDQEFETYLNQYLQQSRYSDREYIRTMVTIFESKTKRHFSEDKDKVFVQFGRSNDVDLSVNIHKGSLTIKNREMCKFFKRPIDSIVGSVNRLLTRGNTSCKLLVLVGGFSESRYLRDSLRRSCSDWEIDLLSSNEPTSKAAAIGACVWRLQGFVHARAARYTYGTSFNVIYDPRLHSHVQRKKFILKDAAGDHVIPGAFMQLVRKGAVVWNDQCYSEGFVWESETEDMDLGNWSVDLLASRDVNPGEWTIGMRHKNSQDKLLRNFSRVCTLRADLSGLRGALTRGINSEGKPYWRVEYSIEIFFGRTSLSASIVWKENGIRKEGKVEVIPDSVA